MNKLALVILSIAVLFTGSCSKDPDAKVLAKVNGSNITAADFRSQLDDLPPQMRQAVAGDPQVRRDFLNDLVGIELVLQEARRQGLHKDAEFKKRQERLRKELERRIEEDYKNELFNSLLRKQLSDKIMAIPEPSSQEVREFYNKNKKMMRDADGRTLSLKEVELQIKNRLMQEKQREFYVAFTQELKAKANVTVDEKALEEIAASLAAPVLPGGMPLDHPALQGMGAK